MTVALRSFCVAFVMVAVPLMTSRSWADDNDSSCADEEAALKKLSKRDPSLEPPKDKKAAEHVKEGNRAYRAADFETAIEEYTAAAMLDDAPVLLYNLGQANRKSKQYEKAIHQYKLFLDRGEPGPELRALIECNVRMMNAELESAAAKQPPQEPAPDGSESRPSGGTDTVAERDTEEETKDPSVTSAATLPSPWYADGLGWALTGSGVVMSGAGGVLLLNASSLYDEASHEDRDDVRQELRDRAATRQTWGIVVGAAGVVTLAVGIVRLVMTPDAPAGPAESGLSLIVAPDHIGLAGTF